MKAFPTTFLLLSTLVLWTSVVSQPPTNGGENGTTINGNGSATENGTVIGGDNVTAAVVANDTNGHNDQWSSLSEAQQVFLLHAYFASPIRQEIKSCEVIEECPPTSRCDNTWKVCVPKDSPHFPPTDGMCGKHQDCKPMYHCVNSKCLLTGPLACKSIEDCLTIPGLNFTCVEIPDQVPGKRCWRQCTATKDCLECEEHVFPDFSLAETCRIPPAFRDSVICAENFCKKKLSVQ